MSTMHEQRVDTVRRNLARRDLEQMLVCDPRSIQYLTGAYVEPGERFLGLVITPDAEPTLVLNALFTAPDDAACAVRAFTDTDDPLALVEELCNADAPLGCDKNLPARFLRAAHGGGAAQPASSWRRLPSMAREPQRRRGAGAHARGARTNDRPWHVFASSCTRVSTERDIADQLEGIYRELGARATLSTRS